MDDLISRQAVIEINRSYHGQMPNEVNHRIWIEINELPSAQPEIVRCKECRNRGDDDCPMRFIEWVEYDDDGYIEYDDIIYDYTKDDGFCDRAERRTDERFDQQKMAYGMCR